MIVKHTYTRDRGAARAAVRYYQLRPRGRDELPRSIFTRDSTVARTDADRMLREHQNGNYLVHRITISPSDRERPEDLRDMTRYMMAELEKEKGQRLHWFAVEHRNTDHHHVHVMIAGTGQRESDGATRGVKFSKSDYAAMREDGREYCRMMNRISDRWDEAHDRAHDPDPDQYRPATLVSPGEEEDEQLQRRWRKHPARASRQDHDR